MSDAIIRREPMLVTNAPCPGIFYAFGARYPDGQCHDGHLDDADSEYCYEDFDYRPCPYCKNAEYQAQLVDDGHFMPPYAYGEVVPGDYFTIPIGSTCPVVEPQTADEAKENPS